MIAILISITKSKWPPHKSLFWKILIEHAEKFKMASKMAAGEQLGKLINYSTLFKIVLWAINPSGVDGGQNMRVVSLYYLLMG